MNKVLNRLLPLVILVPGIFLAFYWSSLPPEVPLHFDINGKPDRLGSKKELLVMVIALSALSILVYLLVVNIYRIDPKKYAAENKLRLQRIGFALAVFLSTLTCFIIYSASHGGSRFDLNLVLSGVGLLFAVIGNYLPNLKPNYFAGLRLPWTLENPGNWRKTHALAGKLWFAGGLLLAIFCIFLSAKAAMIFFFGVMLVLILIPCIYSYRYYRHQKNNSPVQ